MRERLLDVVSSVANRDDADQDLAAPERLSRRRAAAHVARRFAVPRPGAVAPELTQAEVREHLRAARASYDATMPAPEAWEAFVDDVAAAAGVSPAP